LSHDEKDNSDDSLEEFITSIYSSPSTSSLNEEDDASREVVAFLHFQLGDDNYAIRGEHIQEIIFSEQITPLPGAPDYIRGVVVHRRHVIGVLDLSTWLKRPGVVNCAERLILVEHGDMTAGICAGSLTQIINIPLQQLNTATEQQAKRQTSPYIDAVITMEDRSLLILNTFRILEDAAVQH